MPNCKYCSSEYSQRIIPFHEARCKENPANKPKPKKKPVAKKTTVKSTEKK